MGEASRQETQTETKVPVIPIPKERVEMTRKVRLVAMVKEEEWKAEGRGRGIERLIGEEECEKVKMTMKMRVTRVMRVKSQSPSGRSTSIR